jgi:hypothetical protein
MDKRHTNIKERHAPMDVHMELMIDDHPIRQRDSPRHEQLLSSGDRALILSELSHGIGRKEMKIMNETGQVVLGHDKRL